jgi:hypothetical protein
MKKYVVVWKETTTYKIVVDAETKEQAKELILSSSYEDFPVVIDTEMCEDFAVQVSEKEYSQ